MYAECVDVIAEERVPRRAPRSTATDSTGTEAASGRTGVAAVVAIVVLMIAVDPSVQAELHLEHMNRFETTGRRTPSVPEKRLGSTRFQCFGTRPWPIENPWLKVQHSPCD